MCSKILTTEAIDEAFSDVEKTESNFVVKQVLLVLGLEFSGHGGPSAYKTFIQLK